MKTKSSVLMFSTLLAAFALLAAPVNAQSADAPERPAKEGAKRPGGDRLEKMREQLGLTDAQIEQLRPIFAAEREELMAKRKELGKDATREQRLEARQAVHEKYKAKIDAILTAEQKEKIAKQRERMAKRPGGPGAPEGAGQE